MNQVLSLYGNTALVRGFCDDCGSMAIIRDEKFLCCDAPVKANPQKVRREVEPEQRRRLPKRANQRLILAEQDYRCVYCEHAFGSTVYRRGKAVVLRVHWDHDIPYSYSQNNPSWNFVAACHVCNLLKSDFIFRDLDDARLYLRTKRIERGYEG